MRIEEDCIGQLEIPSDALYGINALRASINFPIHCEKVDPIIINCYIYIKKAAAITNLEADVMGRDKVNAIVNACDKAFGKEYSNQFITASIQGGAGTSVNMNVNEVIANIANKNSKYFDSPIDPNDDVNRSQSTNDTFPTAGKMALIHYFIILKKSIDLLMESLLCKSKEFENNVKIGRTQLEEAVPTTLGKSFKAYYSMIKRDKTRLEEAIKNIRAVNIGGTAIGTGINSPIYYRKNIIQNLNKVTNSKFQLYLADNLIDATQNCDSFVHLSGALKTLSVDLIKMCNDIRLMSSGPQFGIGEITLPAKQAGSSIMPGKINPVIPEVVCQVAFEVIGNDSTVCLAAQAGQLELNAFEPIMIRDLIESEKLLSDSITTLTSNCINGIIANVDTCENEVMKSAILSTVLTPYLGYKKAVNITKEAINKNVSVKSVITEKNILPKNTIKKLFSKNNIIGDQIL